MGVRYIVAAMELLRHLMHFARENPVYVWLFVGGAGVFLLVIGALVATL